jgi:hypothetical protein
MSGGKTYSQLSTESIAQPNNTKLAGLVATVFKGETLRSTRLTERLRLVEGLPDHLHRLHRQLRARRPGADRLGVRADPGPPARDPHEAIPAAGQTPVKVA